MTFTPESDLAKHVRFTVEYDDGSMDVFAVPEAILQQGAWSFEQLRGSGSVTAS